jgi:hypothetical protein
VSNYLISVKVGSKSLTNNPIKNELLNPSAY